MVRADEVRIIGNHDTVLILQDCAHVGRVCEACEDAGIRAALAAAASTAVVSCEEGIADAARAVTAEDNEAGKVRLLRGAYVLEELSELAGGHVRWERELERDRGRRRDRLEKQPSGRNGEHEARYRNRSKGREGGLLVCERKLGQELLTFEVAACALPELHPVLGWGEVALGRENLLRPQIVRLVADCTVEESGYAISLDVVRVVGKRLDIAAEGLLALVEARVELQREVCLQLAQILLNEAQRNLGRIAVGVCVHFVKNTIGGDAGRFSPRDSAKALELRKEIEKSTGGWSQAVRSTYRRARMGGNHASCLAPTQ
eukprot:scaffold128323_cov27-Tisochrysis_lutea.AAC.3